MEFKGTKGKWKIGKQKSTIVSNSKNIEGFQKESGHLDRSYYGGILICESIWKKEDALLISKSLEMLEKLKEGIEILDVKCTDGCVNKTWIDFQNGNGEDIGIEIDRFIKESKQLIKEATEL